MPVIQWNWDAATTSKDARSLQNGQLVSLINFRRAVEGRLQKRPGWDKSTISTFVGGTYAGPCTEQVCSDSLLFRDTSDQLWAKNTNDGKAYFRGASKRAHPTWQMLEDKSNAAGIAPGVARPDGQGGAHKPLSCLKANGELWSFALGVLDSSGLEAYQYTVTDSVTGAVLKSTTVQVTDTIMAYSVFVDSSQRVCLFYVNGTANVYRHVYNSLTSGLSVNDTFKNQAGALFYNIDARPHFGPSDAKIVCAATSYVGTGTPTWGIFRAYATTSLAAPTTSFTTTALAAALPATSGVSILEWDSSDGFWYLAYWGNDPTVTTSTVLILQKITQNSVTVSTSVTLATLTGVGYDGSIGNVSGYVDATTGNRVVFASRQLGTSPGSGIGFSNQNDSTVSSYEYNGSSTTATVIARSAWLASRPFRVSSNWYVLTGFDDGYYGGGVQNGYFVRDRNGVILTSVLDGDAGGEFFAPVVHGYAGGTGTTEQLLYLYDSHVTSPLAVSSTVVALPLLGRGVTLTRPSRLLAKVDFAPTYFSNAKDIVPSGVPSRASIHDDLAELSPIHAPHSPFTPYPLPGTPGSTNYITYLYKVVDSDGNVYRSAPYPSGTATVFDASGPWQVTLPTLRHVISRTKVYIEVYGSVNGGTDMFLQETVPNDASVDSVVIHNIVPANWSSSGELLYTTGRVLINVSVPPARLATTWRNRTWLWGTPDGEIWPSVEHVPGHGPEFKSPLPFSWEDGDTDCAMCELSYDAMVLFRRNAIGLVTGAGPDSRGVGGYQVQTLETEKGCTNPRSVAVGPFGNAGASAVYFQNVGDGRLNAVTGGTVIEVAAGWESFTGYTVSSVTHDVHAGEILFTCTNGRVLAVDYRHPTGEQPAGQVYERSSAALPAFVGSQAIAGAVVALEAGTSSLARHWSPGATFLDDGTQVLVDLTTGRMQPVGLIGEFDVDTSTISMDYAGGNSTYRVTMTFNQGAGNLTDVHDIPASSLPDAMFRAAVYHTRDLQIRIQELAATGEGHYFDGMAVDVQPYGQIKTPAIAKWLP